MAQSEETQGSISWSGIAWEGRAQEVLLANPAGTGVSFASDRARDCSRVQLSSAEQTEETRRRKHNVHVGYKECTRVTVHEMWTAGEFESWGLGIDKEPRGHWE